MRRPRIPSKVCAAQHCAGDDVQNKIPTARLCAETAADLWSLDKDRQIAGISTLSLHHPFVFFIEDF